MLYLETFPVGAFQCNCSILADEDSQEAIILDPGDEADLIIQKVEAKGFRIKYLLHTHAHLDHVGGTLGVQQHLGGEACLHEDDLPLFENVPLQAALFNLPTPPTGTIDQFIVDKDIIKFGAYQMEVLHTPGHTPGSVSFYLESEKKLFTGDTLFLGSIGRTDLWGGSYPQIIQSIEDKILPLDQDTHVLPGHGANTTLAQERQHNPFIKS